MNKRLKKPTHNEKIPYLEFIVIDQNGKNLGRMTKGKAIAKARGLDLDLILLADNPKNPVCRIVNLSKYFYEQQKTLKKATKKNNLDVIKEVRFFAQIAENDLQLRLQRTIRFLSKGHTVRVRMFLRGREKYIKDFGLNKIKTFIQEVEKHGTSDKALQKKANFYFIQFKPRKKRTVQKEELSKTEK